MSETYYLLHEDTPTSIGVVTVSQAPTAIKGDSYKIFQYLEVLGSSDDVVAVRMSWHVEWFYKPFIQAQILGGIEESMRQSALVAPGWF